MRLYLPRQEPAIIPVIAGHDPQPRGTEHWDNLYRHRTLAERSINILKDDFGVAKRRSFSVFSAKANLFLAGITQLITLILAVAVNQPKLFKSVRRLIAVA